MRIPWSAGVVSDAALIGLREGSLETYELKFVNVINDALDDLGAWTEVDPDNKVNLSNNVLTLDGDGSSYTTHGVWRTAGWPLKIGYAEIEFSNALGTLANNMFFGLQNATELGAYTSAQNWKFGRLSTGFSSYGDSGLIWNTIDSAVIEDNVRYKVKFYTLKSPSGTYSKFRITIQGGSGIFQKETELGVLGNCSNDFTTPVYFAIQRRASSAANPLSIYSFKVFSEYTTSSPHVEYICDAGADKFINGLDFTNLALPSGISDTNLEFDYSFDDGTPGYSSKYTLTNLKALGSISGAKRYLRIRIYANSNGETQTYVASVNANDACSSIGESEFKITSITPAVGSVDGGTTVTLSGKGLSLLTGVTFDGVAGTELSIASDTSATIKTPAGDAGQVDLVASFTGYDDVTVEGAFTYQSGASVPEAFTATAISWGVSSIKIEWNASAGAMTYRVFRDTVDVSGELRNLSKWVDASVSNGSYEYIVTAYNETGDTNSNTVSITKGAGGYGTVYGVLMAIYRAMFNQQKIEKIGSTYYLNTYDDDDTTLLASCALKTFDEEDIEDLAGTVTPSIRLRSVISAVGETINSTVYGLLSKVFKKDFLTRKNEYTSPGIMSEVVYDEDDSTKISQQHLQTFDGDEIPPQTKVYTPQIRMKSEI